MNISVKKFILKHLTLVYRHLLLFDRFVL